MDAVKYYQRFGYTYLDVPWAVSKEAVDITRPKESTGELPHYTVDAGTKVQRHGGWYSNATEIYPVASAEQSFLQLQLTNVRSSLDSRDSGGYVTLTPCFRNEPILDDLHQPYFMKVELIDWTGVSSNDVHDMIQLAYEFFSEYLPVDVVENKEKDAGAYAFDIVSRRGRIEVGSYGVRQNETVGLWLYGTGCAEPRLSYAIEVEDRKNQPNQSAQTNSASGKLGDLLPASEDYLTRQG
jgi:hypothetical protein